MSVLRLPSEPDSVSSRTVAIVSADHSYRRALGVAFAERHHCVVSGPDMRCLDAVEGWNAEWRQLDVAAIVIDLGAEIEAGLDALDAVRRRDPHAFVIVLSRVFGSLGTARVGANLILEGDVTPDVVVDTLTRHAQTQR